VDTAKQVGDVNHIKVFASVGAAETWFEEKAPEKVAFEDDVIALPALFVRRCKNSQRLRTRRVFLINELVLAMVDP
jgi:hypothetical protein